MTLPETFPSKCHHLRITTACAPDVRPQVAPRSCVVRQSCSLDTVSRTWACLTWDTRTKMLTSQTGEY